jgi:hypothetical protein
MESADPIRAWHDLYVMLGTSSAALVGLIFVAASLHLGDIVRNPAFRIRAYHATLYLLTLLVEAVLVLVPQPVPVLGAQLGVLNLVGLWVPLSTAYRYYYKDRVACHRAGITTARTVTYSVAYLLGIFGAVTLFESPHWGIYLVTASYMTLLVTVVLGTWAVALGIGETEGPEKTDNRPQPQPEKRK